LGERASIWVCFCWLSEEGGAGGGAMKAFMLWVVVGIVREREAKQ